MRYQFRTGRSVKGLTAAEVAAELQRIADANGGDLTPQAVVTAARPVGSVLHGAFDWDKGRAAMQHWLEVSRGIITAVHVVVAERQTSEPLYVHVATPGAGSYKPGSYRPLAVVITDDDALGQLLDDYHRRIGALRSSLGAIEAAVHRRDRGNVVVLDKAFAGVRDSLSTVEARVHALRAAV